MTLKWKPFLHKILYLGLDPPPGAVHYPVIYTKRLETSQFHEAAKLWARFTHVIFTSKTAVRYWPFDLQGKTIIAIGEKTAASIGKKDVLVASESTQEGVLALLKTIDLMNAFLFYPRSKLARPLLSSAFPMFVLDLYETLLQRPEPVPDLKLFDEIIFTSPSTVDGFLHIFGSLPRDKILTPIGPITERKLYHLS